MGKSKAPKSPDPKETSAAQTGTNIGTAVANSYLNNINQVTPDGSLTYSQTGMQKYYDPYTGKTYDIPQFTATQQLSQQQQAIKDQEDATNLNLGKLANSQSSRLNDLLGKPFDLSGAPAAGNAGNMTAPQYQQYTGGPQLQTSYTDDFSADRQKVEDALMSRINPQLEQDRSALEQRLANQGIMPGSKAFETAMNQNAQASNDARMQAILAGGQEQSRLAGLSRDQATFGNNANQQMWNNQFQATQGNNGLAGQQFADQQTMFNAQNAQRNQWLQEQYQQRNQPINEISALLSGAQVTGPNFVNSANSQIATTDVAGIINQDYQNRLGAWQQQQAQTGGILGGLFGLGGKLIGLSDVRSKENIRRVGVLDNGLPVYAYNYKGDGMTHIGLIAQEVEQVNPEAVSRIGDVRIVDYGKAVEAA
ncbi:tail fiber domain-containing protein [Brucella tritici]|uniref:tail fiber domain-containing protein n=1 Tax=Brucella tritici TaxID=94626 RepID=UPI001F2F1C9B|nr:tail fiber domain-containing protein [Brucella tritici]